MAQRLLYESAVAKMPLCMITERDSVQCPTLQHHVRHLMQTFCAGDRLTRSAGPHLLIWCLCLRQAVLSELWKHHLRLLQHCCAAQKEMRFWELLRASQQVQLDLHFPDQRSLKGSVCVQESLRCLMVGQTAPHCSLACLQPEHCLEGLGQ